MQVANPTPAAPSTRERLLDSAIRVIAKDGYQGARLADVARDAGLTTGAIYSNFRDKEDLFLAAFDRIQVLSFGAVEDLPKDSEGLLAAYRQAAERFESFPELQVLTFELALLATRNPRVRRHMEQGMRETVEAYATRLPGRPGSDRTTRAALLLAMGNGLELVRMFAPELVPLDVMEASLRRVVTDHED